MENKTILKIERTALDLPMPEYSREGDSGMDLRSTIDYNLMPGETKCIDTGIKIELPEGFEGQVRGRSGIALKHSVSVLNSPGTIDLQYRGNIGVILHNHSEIAFKIKRGDRICQLVISPVAYARIDEVDKVNKTERGKKGFGSSGVK